MERGGWRDVGRRERRGGQEEKGRVGGEEGREEGRNEGEVAGRRDLFFHFYFFMFGGLICIHRGHTVSVYILGHRSTWACCYCPKNNKCTIQHAKAKK